MDNNKLGIWTIHKEGVKGSPENLPDVQINNIELWTTTKRGEHNVWDCPIHFAEKLWCDEEQAVNLIQALAIAREHQNSENPKEFPVDIDEQTIRIMLKIIDERTEQSVAE
jgi:hypothetical protein